MSILLVFLLAVWDLNSMKCEIFSNSRVGSAANSLDDSTIQSKHPENDLVIDKEKDHLRDLMHKYYFDKDMRDFPTRRSGSKSLLQSITQRRSPLDNNFMRFGRTKLDKRQSEAVYGRDDVDDLDTNEYRYGRNGAGVTRDSRGDNFMRFGRSNSLMRFGRANNMMRFGRALGNSLMRFGRGSGNLMRFGRANNGFIRFGRAGFMRFGRDPNTILRLLDETDVPLTEDPEDEKNMSKRAGSSLMRFGRSENFMRFGKLDKNFMRFGKRDDEDYEDNEKQGSTTNDSNDPNSTDNEEAILYYLNLLRHESTNDNDNGNYSSSSPEYVAAQ